jgi:adenine-specific DNA methylase
MFREVVLITFDELVFPDIQQEVVLLLADGRRDTAAEAGTFHTIRVRNGEDLLRTTLLEERVAHATSRHARPGMKWTALFLDEKEFDTLEQTYSRDDVAALSDYASVDVGIVTGRNSFFVMSTDEADRIGINGHAVPILGRTSALRSIVFNDSDMEAYQLSNPSRLLNLRGVTASAFSAPLRRYIKSGELEGVNRGYKCSVRPRWYDVPSVYVPDAFLFRQIHNAPLMVANHARATATDTIHRVRTLPGIEVDRLCAASVNSLTFAWAEVCGRSYGGGVLELEPREAEELPCLYSFAQDLDAHYVDAQLRNGDIDSALQYADDILLRRGLGLSASEVRRLNDAWQSLRNKRQGRRRGSSAGLVSELTPGAPENVIEP